MLLENWGIVQKMSLINSIINKHDVVTYNAGHFFGLKKRAKNNTKQKKKHTKEIKAQHNRIWRQVHHIRSKSCE